MTFQRTFKLFFLPSAVIYSRFPCHITPKTLFSLQRKVIFSNLLFVVMRLKIMRFAFLRPRNTGNANS